MSKDSLILLGLLVTTITTFWPLLANSQPTLANANKPDVSQHPVPVPGDGSLNSGSVNVRPLQLSHDLELRQSQLSPRSRRSSGTQKLQPQLSAEMQEIMSGNWHGMDEDSLVRLLTSFASKESLPDDYFGDEAEEDEPAIDLVYYGRDPSRSSSYPRSSPHTPPRSEPISRMSSSGKPYNRVRDELYYDDAQPLHLHRLMKKAYPVSFFTSRSHLRKNWPHPHEINLDYDVPRPLLYGGSGRRDLVQLSSGEIAFTPHGLNVLRYHQPLTLPEDKEIPVIRRPIL